MIVAELAGEARHHARWRELTGDEQATAVAGLREIAGGRADLLAEVAGILEGTSEGELDEPLVRQAADLCRRAGADETLIPEWIEEGRRRAESARKMPHSERLSLRAPPAAMVIPCGTRLAETSRQASFTGSCRRGARPSELREGLDAAYGTGGPGDGDEIVVPIPRRWRELVARARPASRWAVGWAWGLATAALAVVIGSLIYGWLSSH